MDITIFKNHTLKLFENGNWMAVLGALELVEKSLKSIEKIYMISFKCIIKKCRHYLAGTIHHYFPYFFSCYFYRCQNLPTDRLKYPAHQNTSFLKHYLLFYERVFGSRSNQWPNFHQLSPSLCKQLLIRYYLKNTGGLINILLY